MQQFLRCCRKPYLGLGLSEDYNLVTMDIFPLYKVINQVISFSATQKDHLDLQVQTLLKKFLSLIQELNQYKSQGQVQELQSAVVLILEQELMKASQVQREMQEVRLKTQSVLQKKRYMIFTKLPFPASIDSFTLERSRWCSKRSRLPFKMAKGIKVSFSLH